MDNLSNIVKYSKQIKLLYVEDNPEARQTTLVMFNEFFKEVRVAVDGEDGFNAFQEDQFDLIITDINMPKLNGIEMIEKIRTINKNIPILVLSAYNESGYFMDSIKLGVEGYLLKPVNMEQFLGVLEKVVATIKLQQEVKKNLYFLEQYQNATDASSIVSKTDLKGIITYVNDEFCKISGYPREELIGQAHNIVRHPDNPSTLFQEIWDTIKVDKKAWQGILRNKSKNNKSYYVKTTIQPILDQDGNILEYIALRDDVTDVMNPKKQFYDLVGSVDEAIVILVKIERFDDIEKFYGQQLSVEIEQKFAHKLLEYMPQRCTFEKTFVLGDGEYAFAKDKANCVIGIDNLIIQVKEFQKIVNSARLDIGELQYDISVVVSVSYGKNSIENAKHGLKEILLNNSDFIIASDYLEKEQVQAGKNFIVLQMIRQAIEDKKIISYFQPIVNNATQEIDKYESLVRLVDEEDKVLSPYFFLDISKKGKYYTQITSIVLDNSFDALNQTTKDISINLSALDIEKVFIREKIFQLLEQYKEQASRLVFELLEDEVIKDFELIKTFIMDVKEYGVQIAIDDFGAGYSNFERLLDYQPDILKIDASLIKNIEHDSYSLNVVETIIVFAKKQNIKIVAEYVENENIFKILRDLDVDYSQGYYFAKPDLLSAHE